MQDCNHEQTKRQRVTRPYLGLSFTAEMDVCATCGAALWDNAVDKKFQIWLGNLPQEHRDKLTLQPFFSKHASECIENLVARFPGVQTSTLIRAMVSVFMNSLGEKAAAATVESITETEIFQSFKDDLKDRRRHSVVFKPVAMLDIHEWSSILGFTPSKFVEEAVTRILAISYVTDLQLQTFWIQQILPKIKMIVNAA